MVLICSKSTVKHVTEHLLFYTYWLGSSSRLVRPSLQMRSDIPYIECSGFIIRINMEPQSGNIKITRTARYYMLGNRALPIKIVVYVLHGYGMGAKTFISKFESLLKPGVLIVAPEGLSRFYSKGFSGDVIASWMTREDRESEIDDYVNYLDALHKKLVPSGSVKTIVLGFSQGASTGSRWLVKGTAGFDEFIIWCGELGAEIVQKPVKQPVIRHVFAYRDEFISKEQFASQSKRIQSLFSEVREYGFDGTHVIDQPTLMTVFKDIGI